MISKSNYDRQTGSYHVKLQPYSTTLHVKGDKERNGRIEMHVRKRELNTGYWIVIALCCQHLSSYATPGEMNVK